MPFQFASQLPTWFRFRVICLCVLSCPRVFADLDQGDVEFFERKIRPALAHYCYECHSAAAADIKGGLRLDSRSGLLQGGATGPAVVPGDVDGSLLISAIRRQSLEMPPDKKLPPAVLADFERWVAGEPPTRGTILSRLTRQRSSPGRESSNRDAIGGVSSRLAGRNCLLPTQYRL